MNQKESILIIEDEPQISRFLSLELDHEGYKCATAADGRQGLELALEKDFDLIILDIMLPSLNGIEVLRRLRQNKNTPVIILTARDQVIDKVNGLDIGANDYMTKPFDIAELLARIRVNIRKNNDKLKFLQYGKLKLDCDSVRVYYGDEEIKLTKKQFDLLKYLLQNLNVVISRQKILDVVWGFDFYGNTNVVDVYVRYLRARIDDKFKVKIIHTVRGSGYVIRS